MVKSNMIKKAILTVLLITLTGMLIIASGRSPDTKEQDKNEADNIEDLNISGEDNTSEENNINEEDKINEAGNSGTNDSGNSNNSDASNDSGASDNGEAAATSLGGISLGDTPQAVINILGKNYTESTEPDIAGYVGEDMTVWSYESGITVIFGKTSGKVLKVTTANPDFKTDLGIKVGDDAKTVYETYKSLSEEAESRHSNEILEGWFLMKDGAVMIFDFDKSDGAMVNSNVTPDSKVEEIILAYWNHFD